MFKPTLLKKYIGVIFLVIAGLIIFWLFSSDVEDEIVAGHNGLPRVTVMSLPPQKQATPIASQGNVSARWRSVLKSDAAGRVVYVSPMLLVGGEFQEGDILLRLEDSRYQAELAEAQSALANAKQLQQQEQQQAALAKQDWQTSGLSGQPSDLLLRKPQLFAANSQVKAAQAALKRAQLMLVNTNIAAPYTGSTISRHISLGDYLAEEAEIAEIYAHEQLQVSLSLPPEHLFQSSIQELPVILRSVNGEQQWQAKVARQSRVIDPKSRRIKIIVELSDDVASKDLPLLGQFVEAEIKGPMLSNVLRIPESCISGDSRIWHVDKNSKLQLLEHRYLSEHQQHIYLQVLSDVSDEILNIACFPSKTFFVGMAVAMQAVDK